MISFYKENYTVVLVLKRVYNVFMYTASLSKEVVRRLKSFGKYSSLKIFNAKSVHHNFKYHGKILASHGKGVRICI